MYSYSVQYLMAHLTEPDEQYRFETPTGPIMVSEIMYWINQDEAKVRGWAINADGKTGLIMRNGHCQPKDLPREVRRQFEVLLQRKVGTDFLEVS